MSTFVIGWPIDHSRSPIIHRYWLSRYGINGDYRKIAVAPGDLPAFINRLREGAFLGGNVTIPHKETVFSLADICDEHAETLQAANTLWRYEGKIYASNTDSYGFLHNLDEKMPGWDRAKKAVILGAGGASRAIIYGLICRGFTDICIANRTEKKAQILVDHFQNGTSAHSLAALHELILDADLLVNTTPLGVNGIGMIKIDFDTLPSHTLVSDIVYVPLMTPMLLNAQAHGLRTVDGLGMLLHQAVLGFEKWFGKRPEVDKVLRQLIIDDMGIQT